MADYGRLIDAETWRFIERTDSFYPPDTATRGISEQRAIYDRLCAAFRRERPADVTVTDESCEGPDGAPEVRLRRYEPTPPADATLLYCHGGGFVVGGLDSHDDVCAELCARTGLRVVSVDYRLCPEHIHPAAFEDAKAALAHLRKAHGERVVFAGDSAGGNLVAALAHAMRGTFAPLGQVLIYPGLGGDTTRGSYVEHAAAPMLTTADVVFYSTIRTGGQPRGVDPTLAPLRDTRFDGLPPTLIVTAQCDPLSDDGRDYAAAIEAAGGMAEWIEDAGLVHGWLRARHDVARARASFERIAAAVIAMAAGTWRPSGRRVS